MKKEVGFYPQKNMPNYEMRMRTTQLRTRSGKLYVGWSSRFYHA